jgi:hypothetical protein
VLACELAAVMNEETGHTGEFIVSAQHHLDQQLLVGQVSAGKVKPSAVSLSSTSMRAVWVVALRGLNRLERFIGRLVFLADARSVIVGCHWFDLILRMNAAHSVHVQLSTSGTAD